MINDIIKLDISNLKAIIEFDKLCFPLEFWKEEDWISLLNDKRAIYYSFMQDEKIIAGVFIYNWYLKKDYVKIMNIAVHPNYTNQGLAHKLLNHVTKMMKEIGVCRFCGETRSSNIKMQKVFEGCGYELNIIEKDYYENPKESAYKYVLQLQ